MMLQPQSGRADHILTCIHQFLYIYDVHSKIAIVQVGGKKQKQGSKRNRNTPTAKHRCTMHWICKVVR